MCTTDIMILILVALLPDGYPVACGLVLRYGGALQELRHTRRRSLPLVATDSLTDE